MIHPVDHYIVRTLRAEGRLNARSVAAHTGHGMRYIRQRLDALTAAGRVQCIPVPNPCGTLEKRWDVPR